MARDFAATNSPAAPPRAVPAGALRGSQWAHLVGALLYSLTGAPPVTYLDGRWNDANSPIDPWQHGNEGGAERGDRKDHLPA